jgi:hypothetical protein
MEEYQIRRLIRWEDIDKEGSALEDLGTATSDDISDFDEAAQDAVGSILADTSTIDFTYTDATPEITATVKDNSLVVGKLTFTATDKLAGRSTSGSGAGEEITCTAAGRALLDDATAADQRTTLDVPSNSEAILDTIIAAKGDLIVGTADNTPAILTVGATDGHVLTIDSGETTGLKWAAASGSGSSENNYDYVTLLLNLNGSDGSTTFTDEKAATTFTANGNAQLDTADKKYGSASLLLDGTGDYLTASANTAFSMGYHNFTIECWIKMNGIATYWPILECRTAASFSAYIMGIFVTGGNNRVDWVYGAARLTGATTALATGQWYHLAFTRDRGWLAVWVDGNLEISGSLPSTTMNPVRADPRIGSNVDGNFANGWIDDFRITKGVARYSKNFTPPTAELGHD